MLDQSDDLQGTFHTSSIKQSALKVNKQENKPTITKKMSFKKVQRMKKIYTLTILT